MNLFLSGLMLGLTFCAMPGAVNVEALRVTLRGGLAAALGLELGSLVGDATYGALSMLGLAAFLHVRLVQGALGVLGIGMLLYSAWDGLRQAWRAEPVAAALSGNPSAAEAEAVHGGRVAGTMALGGGRVAGSTFLQGALISLGNPGAIVFWLSIGSVMVQNGVSQVTGQSLFLFYLSYMLGCTFWAVGFSLLAAWGRRLLHPGFFRWLAGAASAGLLIFAGVLARNTWQLLWP